MFFIFINKIKILIEFSTFLIYFFSSLILFSKNVIITTHFFKKKSIWNFWEIKERKDIKCINLSNLFCLFSMKIENLNLNFNDFFKKKNNFEINVIFRFFDFRNNIDIIEKKIIYFIFSFFFFIFFIFLVFFMSTNQLFNINKSNKFVSRDFFWKALIYFVYFFDFRFLRFFFEINNICIFIVV